MRLRFSSGSSTPAEAREEALGRVDVDERHAEVLAKVSTTWTRLVLAQKPVVDEDAGELVADGLVHEQRGDRRVDAARERAEDPLPPDLRANASRLLLDDRCRRPRGRRVRDLVQEVASASPCRGRVNDLRVELDAVEAPRSVLEGRDRRRGRGRDGSGALGRPL